MMNGNQEEFKNSLPDFVTQRHRMKTYFHSNGGNKRREPAEGFFTSTGSHLDVLSILGRGIHFWHIVTSKSLEAPDAHQIN